jgi:hypothetical protein
LRRAIEHDWDARVVEIYGSNETMLMGVGCPQGRLHLCTDLIEAEVLDPETHAPVPPGQAGVMTITSLVHEVMPLVRYFTGDLVRVAREPCHVATADPPPRCWGVFDDSDRNRRRPQHALRSARRGVRVRERLGTRIFFVLIRPRTLHLLVEVEHPQTARDPANERRLAERIGLPVVVEYLAHNDVLDRSAIYRGPKIYKPSVISDWRGDARKTITIMEALLEWPKYDWRTVMHLLRRQIRNATTAVAVAQRGPARSEIRMHHGGTQRSTEETVTAVLPPPDSSHGAEVRTVQPRITRIARIRIQELCSTIPKGRLQTHNLRSP